MLRMSLKAFPKVNLSRVIVVALHIGKYFCPNMVHIGENNLEINIPKLAKILEELF